MRGGLAWACCAAAAACGSVSAGTLEFELATRRVFRGLEKSGVTLTASAEESRGDLYGGVVAAMALGEGGPAEDFQDEVDLYAGYGWALSRRAALDAGATLYHYPQGRDSYEGYVGVYGQLGSFAPACYLYRDVELGTTTVELSLAATSPLPRWPIELEARVGHARADDGADYSYHGIDATYRLELGRGASAAFRLGYSGRDGDGPDARRGLLASAAFRVGF